MIVDGLTKALTTSNHEALVGMTAIEDQTNLLASIQKGEDLRAAPQRRTGPEINVSFGYGADVTSYVQGCVCRSCLGHRISYPVAEKGHDLVTVCTSIRQPS